jgi:hypothetical protein
MSTLVEVESAAAAPSIEDKESLGRLDSNRVRQGASLRQRDVEELLITADYGPPLKIMDAGGSRSWSTQSRSSILRFLPAIILVLAHVSLSVTNAAETIVNSPAFTRAVAELKSDRVEIRRRAIVILAQDWPKESVPILIESWKDGRIRKENSTELFIALAESGGHDSASFLVGLMDDDTSWVDVPRIAYSHFERLNADLASGKAAFRRRMRTEPSRENFSYPLGASHYAALIAWKLGDAEGLNVLIQALQYATKDDYLQMVVHKSAAELLGEINRPLAIQALIAALSDDAFLEEGRSYSENPSRSAIRSLAKLKAKESGDVLLKIASENKSNHEHAVVALGDLGFTKAIPLLISQIQLTGRHGNEMIHMYAGWKSGWHIAPAIALGNIGNPSAVPPLIDAFEQFNGTKYWVSGERQPCAVSGSVRYRIGTGEDRISRKQGVLAFKGGFHQSNPKLRGCRRPRASRSRATSDTSAQGRAHA